MIKINGQYVKMDTLTTSLIIRQFDGRAELVHYGKRLHDAENYGRTPDGMRDKWWASNCDYTNVPVVLSSNSESAQKSAFAGVIKNGIFSNRFEYVGAEMVDGFSSPLPTARAKGDTVRLTYKDVISSVTLYQYYTVFDDSDVIAAHSELVNTTDERVTVNRLFSLQLDFVAREADVTTFDGWWCHERTRHDVHLTAGRFENSSISGISSGEHNPFVMVKVGGRALGLNLIWSGNHKELIEISSLGRVRIQTGMNDYQLSYDLAPGETLVSPEAIVVSAPDEAAMTHELHKFSLNHIINPTFAYRDRPILINNWEGTGFNFTGEKIYAMAEKAAECGIEMFVLDDGWFGNRNLDTCALGDWYDNAEKTGGLKNLADRIRSLGMKFGLWVEPEMICFDSDLFRAHPEYAQIIPGVNPIQRRTQLCIDLCNPAVVDYLADTLIALFQDLGVDYVKWDHNRSMSDIYSSKLESQGRYFYDYYVNQYALLRRITEACPGVLFESCSSGGCRYDLGMQYFMPQNWASDNTNAYARLFIQEGTLIAYPQSSMGAHVAAPHSVPRISIESRFNVAAAGAFGYEFDITAVSDEERAIITDQVAYYKEHRHLLQFGNYTRIGDSLNQTDLGGWMVVSDDKSEAIAVIIDKSENNNYYDKQCHHFAGLDEDALYHVTMRKQANVGGVIEFDAYGDSLMHGNLDFGYVRLDEQDSHAYSARFASRMFYIQKV